MNCFKQLLVGMLILQLILGSGGLAWGQVSRGSGKGDKGTAEGKSPRSMQGGGVRPGKSGGGGREGGVESLAPAKDKLPGGRALSRAVVPGQYILGPGDGLIINIWGEFEDIYEVQVTPDGKINLPTVGELKVRGLSLTQAEALVETQVKRYYRNVKSGLSLASLRVFEVSVLGAVYSPGTYLATPVKRVSDLIAEAGGVVQGGSWRHVQLRREGRTVAVADVSAYIRRGDVDANPTVEDGDVVYIPPMGNMVVMVITNEVAVSPQSGQVTENSAPSNVELREGERLADLFSELGSVSAWWKLEDVYILRETTIPEGTMKIPVDAKRLLYGGDESQNIELQAGDQVFISSNVRRVFVNGMVTKGGAFPYVPNRTAEEYLGLAGGVSLQASLGRSTINHADGTVEPFRSNTILQSGDSIQVAQKYFATPADYVGLIGGAISLVFSSFAFLTVLK